MDRFDGFGTCDELRESASLVAMELPSHMTEFLWNHSRGRGHSKQSDPKNS